MNKCLNYQSTMLSYPNKSISLFGFKIREHLINNRIELAGMERNARNREKRREIVVSEGESVERIRPPESFLFIISPCICLEALEYIPLEKRKGVDEMKAIKELLFMKENLQASDGLLSVFQKQLKVSLNELDEFWLKKFNSFFKDCKEFRRDITLIKQRIALWPSPFCSYRQVYFEMNPKQRYNNKNPLGGEPIHSTSSKDKYRVALHHLEEVYNQVLNKWESHIKKQKGNILQFYQALLQVIHDFIQCKSLDDVPLSFT